MKPQATPNPREYRSPDGSQIRVPLDDGRVALVSASWRNLPLDFHASAVREGCQVRKAAGADADTDLSARAVGKAKAKTGAAQAGDDSQIREALFVMFARDQPGDFVESTGLPDLKVLSSLAGYAVDVEQATRVLRAMQAEAEAEAAATAAAATGGEGEGEGDSKAADTGETVQKTAGQVATALRNAKAPDEVSAEEAARNKRRADAQRRAKQAQKTGTKPTRSAATA